MDLEVLITPGGLVVKLSDDIVGIETTDKGTKMFGGKKPYFYKSGLFKVNIPLVVLDEIHEQAHRIAEV